MGQELDANFLLEVYRERIAELEHEIMIYKALAKQKEHNEQKIAQQLAQQLPTE